MRKVLSVVVVLAIAGWLSVRPNAQSSAVVDSLVTMSPDSASNTGAEIDYVNAKAMPLPRSYSPSDQLEALLAPASNLQPAARLGNFGDGLTNLLNLGRPAAPDLGEDEVSPEEFGTSNHPFSTARADLSGIATNTQYPYRAAGKLFFNIGTSTFVCSASLIKRESWSRRLTAWRSSARGGSTRTGDSCPATGMAQRPSSVGRYGPRLS